MSMPDADPHLYKLFPTRTYPLLHLRMRVTLALFGLMAGVVCALL
jgi:hypothetical protein